MARSRRDWQYLKYIIRRRRLLDGDPMVLPGEFVQITEGFVLGDSDIVGPIPTSLKGCFGEIVLTGEQITVAISAGPAWGFYEKKKLPEPIEELQVKIVSPGQWKDKLLDVDGLIWRKLSPLEVLALQKVES